MDTPLKLLTLTPLKRAPRCYEIIALDTEGDGSPHGFRLAACWDADGGHLFRRPRDLQNWLFVHRHRDKRILAANLEYDWATAFQPFSDRHSILLAGGKWLSASYSDLSGHSYTAWDICAIAPISVAAMGDIVGLAKYPTPPALVRSARTAAAHYECADHHRTDCVECYCLRDAQIVYEFAKMFQRDLNELGGQLKMTAASCSMDLFRRRFLDDEIAPSFEFTNEFARRGLYGGRTENFKAGTARDITAYDFNSLYPAIMRDLRVGLPHTFHHLSSTHRLLTRLDSFGVVDATIKVPESYLPVLPSRQSGHNYYASGMVRGVWTFSEVRYAIENGATLVDSGEIVFADQTTLPFKTWCDVLYARKQQQTKTGDASVEITKMILNALWGKFAQRVDDDLAAVIFPRGKFSYADYAGYEPHALAGREVLLKHLDPTVQSPHIHVLWGAEIAARARIQLHQTMRDLGSTIYYCDTDSIHTDIKLQTGDGLGELKKQYSFQRVAYLAPKEYGGLDEQGNFIGHAKGIPVNQQREFLEQGSARFERPQHILEALRGGGRIAEWKTVIKSRRAHPPCRDHIALADYNRALVDSRPWDAGTIPDD